MATILEEILATKRKEVARAKELRPLERVIEAARGTGPVRSFASAVQRSRGSVMRVIAEIKRSSPSAGVIIPEDRFDPAAIAEAYTAAGANALSILTDEPYFGGRLEYIEIVRGAVDLPCLRKDFVIDEYQVYEARAAGADAILLIAEALDVRTIARWAGISREFGMATLVEIHSADNLRAVLDELGVPGGASYILGINNRDLHAQLTDVRHAVELSKLLPTGALWVAESGIRTRADVELIEQVGASAILVGESLLRSGDVGTKLRELIHSA